MDYSDILTANEQLKIKNLLRVKLEGDKPILSQSVIQNNYLREHYTVPEYIREYTYRAYINTIFHSLEKLVYDINQVQDILDEFDTQFPDIRTESKDTIDKVIILYKEKLVELDVLHHDRNTSIYRRDCINTIPMELTQLILSIIPVLSFSEFYERFKKTERYPAVLVSVDNWNAHECLFP